MEQGAVSIYVGVQCSSSYTWIYLEVYSINIYIIIYIYVRVYLFTHYISMHTVVQSCYSKAHFLGIITLGNQTWLTEHCIASFPIWELDRKYLPYLWRFPKMVPQTNPMVTTGDPPVDFYGTVHIIRAIYVINHLLRYMANLRYHAKK